MLFGQSFWNNHLQVFKMSRTSSHRKELPIIGKKFPRSAGEGQGESLLRKYSYISSIKLSEFFSSNFRYVMDVASITGWSLPPIIGLCLPGDDRIVVYHKWIRLVFISFELSLCRGRRPRRPVLCSWGVMISFFIIRDNSAHPIFVFGKLFSHIEARIPINHAFGQSFWNSTPTGIRDVEDAVPYKRIIHLGKKFPRPAGEG